MRRSYVVAGWLTPLVAAALACGTLSPASPASTAAPTRPVPVSAAGLGPDEPVSISGEIPFTSPFFLAGNAEPFVLLEDETGFIRRDREFIFPLEGQAIGPVEQVSDNALRYTLPLPSAPLGTLVDLDHDGAEDRGVMVFAIAYWSNTWGGPFLEARDGRGWSNAYTSARTDPNQEDEIVGGTLLIWAPDGEQEFASDFGPDGLLSTEDDPMQAVPAGYSLVDLDERPFRLYKEPTPSIDLLEGETAVNDFSSMTYAEAFAALFDKVSLEYPFTEEKGIDWEALRSEFKPRFEAANDYEAFYRALKDFTLAIPDGHVGGVFDNEIFFEDFGASFGLVLAELSDGTIIASQVLSGYPAAEAGILRGAEILAWDGQPVQAALDEVVPYFGPFSTPQAERPMQLVFLTRVPEGTSVGARFQNPGSTPQDASLQAVAEYDSYFASFPDFFLDELQQPVEGAVLDESGLGFMQITSFAEDYNLMARLWDYHMQKLIDGAIPALILDVRSNPGGSGGLAADFAGYFFDEAMVLSQRSYYNERTGQFEARGIPDRLEPGPLYFDGPVAILVGPDCASACEGFVYTMSQGQRATIVGHSGTAGAYGEVGRGQYTLPGDLSLQFPTGRPETMDGQLVIEGKGIQPDIMVPVTRESALGQTDSVLQAAIEALLKALGSN
jgi:C-terminal processing protease CtpA/Prc